MHRWSGDRWRLWVTHYAGNETSVAASFIFHLDLFFLCSPHHLFIYLHCRIWLLFLLFWLGQGRQMAPPGWWDMIKERIVGRGKDENSVILLVTRCASSLPSSPTGSSALYVLPPGFVESSCRSRIFWMKLNKLLLQGKFFQLEINGESQVAALSTMKAGESPKWSQCLWSGCCCHLHDNW